MEEMSMKHGLSVAILALFAVACTGPAGIAGPQGSTGATGTQGYAGVTGSQGQAGMTGAQGQPGMTGAQGRAGVSADRIETGGFGAERAKCNDANEQCSQRDGRVEVMVRPASYFPVRIGPSAARVSAGRPVVGVSECTIIR